ncbi:hypothetical protein CMV16_04700 [Peribacillus simplex]|nr:hypothetical protein CMV16_04700 [Peribacillus simplex]
MPKIFTFQLIGMGVRDSCGKSVSKGDPAGAKSAEGVPPAESECLEWKSTIGLYKPSMKFQLLSEIRSL